MKVDKLTVKRDFRAPAKGATKTHERKEEAPKRR